MEQVDVAALERGGDDGGDDGELRGDRATPMGERLASQGGPRVGARERAVEADPGRQDELVRLVVEPGADGAARSR